MKFRAIRVALVAAVVIVSAGRVFPVEAASPWGLWNDPQGALVAPESGATPAPTVPEPHDSKVQESKPDKKWEMWNDLKPAAAPVPRAIPDAAPVSSDFVPPPPQYQILAMLQVAPDQGLMITAQGPASATAGKSSSSAMDVQASVPAAPQSSPPGAAESVPGEAYVIGAGDVLDIAVWKDEALTRSVTVLPDGTISFPLAGDMRAAGKTVAGFRADMEQRLSRFVTELVLSVEVKQINSMQIYVIGRVNGPGRQILNGNLTVLQALSSAGGLNPFARKDRITVMRTEGGETRSFPVRDSEVIEGENPGQNILLKRGDVVVVP